jgi:hypothetical protein
MTYQRFVRPNWVGDPTNLSRLSVNDEDDVITLTNTALSGFPHAGSIVIARPAAGQDIFVGAIAESAENDPNGLTFENLELPLVLPYQGTDLVNVKYYIVGGPAYAAGSSLAASLARYHSHFQQGAGLFLYKSSVSEWEQVLPNSLIWDDEEETLEIWRDGELEPLSFGFGRPEGEWDIATTYSKSAFITHEGSSYLSRVKDNVGHEPTGAFDAYWILVAQGFTGTVTYADMAAGVIRERLTANRTYYVLKAGSDSNTGLVNNAGGAFLTIAKALSVASTLDCGTFNLTIEVGAGTYAEAVSLPRMLGSGNFTLTGNTLAYDRVISGSGAGAISNSGGSKWLVSGFELTSTTRNIYGSGAGSQLSLAKIKFSGIGAGQQHIYGETGAFFLLNSGTFDIHGGSTGGQFINMARGAQLNCFSAVINLNASVVFSAFVQAIGGSASFGSTTINVGAFTMTGNRFYVGLHGLISTGGAGASYFPGTIAGTTDGSTYGVYA